MTEPSESEGTRRPRRRTALGLVASTVVVLLLAVVAGVAITSGDISRHDSPSASGAPVVVLGKPRGDAFQMVMLRRGDDPNDGVLLTQSGSGRGVIDLRRSLERDLGAHIALGPRVMPVDDHRVAYSIEEHGTRSLILVDLGTGAVKKLDTASGNAAFYSDSASGWLMVADQGPSGETCARVHPAEPSTAIERFTATISCGFEPGGAVVVLNRGTRGVDAVYHAPGRPPVTFPVGMGDPTLDGAHHEIVGQVAVGADATHVVVFDSATGRRTFVSPAANEAQVMSFAPSGAFFVELNDGATSRLLLVRDGHARTVAHEPVESAAVSDGGTALLVEPAGDNDHVIRVGPDGSTDVLLSAPRVELQLVPGAAGAVFAWSAQQTVYSGFADRGPLTKAGTLTLPFTVAYTHPESATAFFVSGGEVLYAVRAGADSLTRLWSGRQLALVDVTNDGRHVVMIHGSDPSVGADGAAYIRSATVPTGSEPSKVRLLDRSQFAIGTFIFEPDDVHMLYTEYQGPPTEETVRVDPRVRALPTAGGPAEVRYDGWSILDLGDSSARIVTVAGEDPSS